MENKEELEKSFKWFLDNVATLSKKYPEKYIAIKDCKVLGCYSSFDEALDKTERMGYAKGTFIVQKASADPTAYTALYFNNYVRM